MKSYYAMVMAFLATSSGNLHGKEVKTPYSDVPCKGNFFLQADLLYWKARQEGLDVFSNISKSSGATTVETDTSTVEINKNKRTYQRLHFDWRAGFRLGAGYNFKDYKWAISSYWTHFHGHGHITGKSNTKGHWSLSYNVLDTIVTGPQFCLGSSFTWKAFGGVRAAMINQKLHVSSESSGTQTNPFSDQNITLIASNSNGITRSNFRGIGPEIGFNLAWSLPKRFSVYATAGGSLLYSHYDAKFSDNFSDTSTFLSVVDPPRTTQFIFEEDATATTNTCQIVVDLGLGIKWQRYACLCNHKINYIFKLGWEHSQWFDHNALGRVGDLCFDGLVLSGQLQF